MSNIKLRAHHGLCIAFFEEKGYDDNFIKNMRTVIAALTRNPDVTIVTGEDIVCVACSNNKDGLCDCNEKVDRYDKAVLRLCNISSGHVLPWKTYKALVNKKIIETGKMTAVCGNCQWTSICFKKDIG